MSKATETKSIIFNIFKCLISFYGVYYVISSICFGAFRLQTFDGKMPFDFKRWMDLRKCCVSYSRIEIANLVAMQTTFFFATWFFLVISHRRLWDYAITISLIHVALSSLVMLSLPTNWSWWLCLALGIFTMISIGEMVSYCYRLNRSADDEDDHELERHNTGLTFYPKEDTAEAKM